MFDLHLVSELTEMNRVYEHKPVHVFVCLCHICQRWNMRGISFIFQVTLRGQEDNFKCLPHINIQPRFADWDGNCIWPFESIASGVRMTVEGTLLKYFFQMKECFP